ncbi:MAG: hypothetical protein ABJA34_07690, partial [Pseudonocardiales bacterium]
AKANPAAKANGARPAADGQVSGGQPVTADPAESEGEPDGAPIGATPSASAKPTPAKVGGRPPANRSKSRKGGRR